jgi:hypothetical protein
VYVCGTKNITLMQIEVDYVLWDLEKKNIQKFKTLKVTEADIIEMLVKKYEDDELPIPIHLSKENLVVEFSVTGGSF